MLGRIADAVRGADVIALQEVSRNNPNNGGRDMVAELGEALPDYFAVYGSNFEANIGSRIEAGRASHRRPSSSATWCCRRHPFICRAISFCRAAAASRCMNFQRGALEALIETPLGFIRFYSTHLDHRSPVERASQIRFLRQRLLNYALEGGGLSGVAEIGLPELPCPEAFVVMGDFNMLAGSPEYVELAGRPDPEFGMPLTADLAVDVAARLGVDRRRSRHLGRPQAAARHQPPQTHRLCLRQRFACQIAEAPVGRPASGRLGPSAGLGRNELIQSWFCSEPLTGQPGAKVCRDSGQAEPRVVASENRSRAYFSYVSTGSTGSRQSQAGLT